MYRPQTTQPLHRLPLLATVLLTSATHAEQLPLLEEVIVEGRREVLVGEARSASEGVIGQMDLATRPLLRPGDVLEAIPGMIVTQHSGSGKSNQMFLRGFNLDHGTDFATSIDGMPVNMRTHGHGQGYTDVNFLVPEMIETLRFVKGPYHAELGDFSSAGGVHIQTYERLDDGQVKLGMGENGYARMLAMGGTEAGPVHFSGAIEAQTYEGPWTDIQEDVQKLNSLLKLAGGSDSNRWKLQAMYYDNEWNSADQIPARAVDQGLIDDLGSVDKTLGGNSMRASLSGTYRRETDDVHEHWSGYVIDYRMQLWSNFTYLLDSPVEGDQFEQVDKRTVWGGDWNRSRRADTLLHTLGASFRYDDIEEVALYRTHARERIGTTRQDSVDQASAGIFYELEWRFTDNWRTVLGLRGDFYQFEVTSDNPLNSGEDSDAIVSPKASLIYQLSEVTEVYLSAGRGFHSNDARGTTISVDPVSGEAVAPVDPLVQSWGGETGFKTQWLERWNSSLTLWYLELDSELLFVGDAGTTEASRPSQRWGLEFNNFWSLNDIWSLEADFAWTDAKFTDTAAEGDEIPGALPFVGSGALTATYPSGWFGSLRLRHFAAYPLLEDNSEKSDGSTLASAALGWSNTTWSLQLDILNIFNSGDHDIDYFYGSRLPTESSGGIEDKHYKTFEPRQVRAHLRYSF